MASYKECISGCVTARTVHSSVMACRQSQAQCYLHLIYTDQMAIIDHFRVSKHCFMKCDALHFGR